MAIKLYWWSGGRGESPTNFGDSISPLLVRELAGKPVEFAPLHRCELIAAGSLLNMAIRSQWRRTVSLRLTPIKVWGTGSLDAKRLDRRHRLDIFAVRGPETRDALGLPPGTPLGDPGLLLSQLVGPVERTCRWGIIPHYVDFHLPVVQALARATPHARLVNVRDPDVLATVRTIASCDFVVSSSLHGLIAADAFGIPNVWVRWSDRVAGGSWKFLDYFRSVGRPERGPEPLPGELREVESRASLAAPQVVEARRRELLAAFRSMAL